MSRARARQSMCTLHCEVLNAHCNFAQFNIYEKSPLRRAEWQQLKMMERRAGDLSLLSLVFLASGSQEAGCEFQVGKGQIQAGNYR